MCSTLAGITTVFSPVPSNASCLMVFSEFGRRTVVRFVQLSKAPKPISSRLSGRMMLVSPVQPQKAWVSIFFTPYRKSTIVRFLQLLKAMSAIDPTLVPMVSLWSHSVPEKTLAPIFVVPLFPSLVALGNTTLLHLLRLSLNENLVSLMLSGRTSSPSTLPPFRNFEFCPRVTSISSLAKSANARSKSLIFEKGGVV